MPVVRKTGELLANLHIVLVKDCLKLLNEKKLMTSSHRSRELVMHGLLLIRLQGAVICSLKMPVVDVVRHFLSQSATTADIPTLSITLESSLGGQTADHWVNIDMSANSTWS